MTNRERYEFRKFINKYYNNNLSMTDNYLVYRLVSEHENKTVYSVTTYRNEILMMSGVTNDKYKPIINKIQRWENLTK